MNSILRYLYIHFCKWQLATSVGLVFFICTGCQHSQEPIAPPKPITYGSLCGLSEDQMGTMNDSAVRNWIKEKYGSYTYNLIDVTRVDPQDNGSVVSYSWRDVKGFYGYIYVRKGYLFAISLHNLKNGLTFGQTVDSLGPPDYLDYDAEVYEDILYDIELDYPHLGISVGMTDMKNPGQLTHNGVFAFHLEKNIPVQWVECYAPAPMEQVLERIFLLPPDMAIRAVQARLPWPGFNIYIPFGSNK